MEDIDAPGEETVQLQDEEDELEDYLAGVVERLKAMSIKDGGSKKRCRGKNSLTKDGFPEQLATRNFNCLFLVAVKFCHTYFVPC